MHPEIRHIEHQTTVSASIWRWRESYDKRKQYSLSSPKTFDVPSQSQPSVDWCENVLLPVGILLHDVDLSAARRPSSSRVVL